MLDLGWSEMAMIAVVALFVIGPKDLPKALRTLGHYGGKIRVLAREFRSSIDDAVREAELEEVKNQIQSVTNMDLDTALDATERLADNRQDSDSESTSEDENVELKESKTTDDVPANKHFARFGEHYTKTGGSASIGSSTHVAPPVDDKDQTPSVSPAQNLPSGVAQVVEARERAETKLRTEAEDAKKTESAAPETLAES